jgi:uncharacterized cupin superfamily protein
VITPGKQSSPRHAHMAEEEIFVVLRGRGTLLRGEERVAVFPAGTGVAHAIVACVANENGEREDRLGRLQEADYFDGEL